MALTLEAVEKIAHLARLNLTSAELSHYATQLTEILEFIEQMSEVDTSNEDPLAHPLNLTQRLRPDEVTESNEREKFQEIAPLVEAGLYLVPTVLE